MVATAVIERVQTYLLRLVESGLPVSFGVVFGSYASGTTDENSDIDVLVVSPQFDKKIERRWINQMWRIAARTDSRIEPVPCGRDQWQHDTANAIVEIARTEGQRVTPN